VPADTEAVAVTVVVRPDGGTVRAIVTVLAKTEAAVLDVTVLVTVTIEGASVGPVIFEPERTLVMVSVLCHSDSSSSFAILRVVCLAVTVKVVLAVTVLVI
jgi:hypothetical protein